MQIVELQGFDYLEVSGPDSKSFLQGQLTCDVDALTANNALPGAICNLKGRVIANFTLLQRGEDCLLQSVAGTGEKLRETLAKFAVFSKVELKLVDPPHTSYGVLGANAGNAFAEIFPSFPDKDFETLEHNEFRVLSLPGAEQRWQIWCLSEVADTRLRQLDAMEELAPLSTWTRAEIAAGMIDVRAELSEEFTPQLLNYDISGVINFNKGCYTGQEVVARMYYRGKPKKRLYLLASDGSLGPASKISTVDDSEKSIAEILVSIEPEEGKLGLALSILPTDAAEKSLSSESGDEGKFSVEILPMPYTE